MANLIGILLITAAAVLAGQAGLASNLLLDAGILAFMVYLGGLTMRRLGLSPVFGYLAAGMIMGHQGFGLISEGLLERSAMLEGLVLVALFARAAERVSRKLSPMQLARSMLAGAIAVPAVALVAWLGLSALPLSGSFAIVAALFAATTAPATVEALLACQNGKNGNNSIDTGAAGFGGLFAAIVLWGIVTSAAGELEGLAAVRAALTPAAIGFTSLIAGIVWGYVVDSTVGTVFGNRGMIPLLAAVFLPFPILAQLHFDILTAGAGIGMYFGLLSERGPFFDGVADWSVPAAFAFLGLRTPLIRLALMDWTSWFVLGSVVGVLVLARGISYAAAARATGLSTGFRSYLLSVAASGPAAALLIRRFIPGYPLGAEGGPGKTETYVILMGVLVVCVAAGTAVEWFRSRSSEGSSAPEEM